MPDAEMRGVLEGMGVVVRNVDEITPGASSEIFKNGVDGFGYVMKAREYFPAAAACASSWLLLSNAFGLSPQHHCAVSVHKLDAIAFLLYRHRSPCCSFRRSRRPST